MSTARRFTIAGFVLAVLALITPFTLLVAPFGVALSVVGLRLGDELGKRAIIANVVGMVLGLLIQAIVYSATN